MIDTIRDLNLKIVHIGINNDDEKKAREVQSALSELLGLEKREGGKSVFVGSVVECMKSNFRGTHGHLALAADDLDTAMEVMQQYGYTFDLDTLYRDENNVAKAVYLNGEIGGFAIHLLKRS